MDRQRDRTQWIKDRVLEAGFDLVGIAPATQIQRSEYFRRWLREGKSGSMHYLSNNVEKRIDPRELLTGAESLIMAALNYHQAPSAVPESDPRGKVAMYAWGQDYHTVMKKKMKGIVTRMRQEIAEPFQAKICVDTTPLLEREFAMTAGLGWIGKNTLVINQKLGSYFFLGAIVTTLKLNCDSPATDHCGSCTRCLEACPTHALPQPYQMDATRCIAYHTIELRDPIPSEYHSAIDDWIFGCDLCQQVCPYNHNVPETRVAEFKTHDPSPHPLLEDVLSWNQENYEHHVKDHAMNRATLSMLQRNARIALANSRSTQ